MLDLSSNNVRIVGADIWCGASASLGIKDSMAQRGGDIPSGGEGYESLEVGPKTGMDATLNPAAVGLTPGPRVVYFQS